MEGILFYYNESGQKIPVASIQDVEMFFKNVNSGSIDLAKYEKETLYLWSLGTAFQIKY